MPIYEYRCEKCGDFEVTQRITEDPLKKCPTCKRKIRKLMSNTSFQLKGSGWYVTDYARAGKDKDKDKGAAKESSGDTASESSASTTETKSESKSETKSDGNKSETKSDGKKKKPSAKAA
jgi:putative FmdB family regulatory protein